MENTLCDLFSMFHGSSFKISPSFTDIGDQIVITLYFVNTVLIHTINSILVITQNIAIVIFRFESGFYVGLFLGWILILWKGIIGGRSVGDKLRYLCI